MFGALLFIHFILALLLLCAILLQKPNSDEIGGISSSGNNMHFSAVRSTAKFLNKFTFILIGLFFFNALILANMSSPKKDIVKKMEQINNDSIPIAK